MFLIFPVHAQNVPKNTSSATWGLGGGSGSYNGIVESPLGSAYGSVPGTIRFTKLTTAFRLLFATGWLDSRLSIGVDYDYQQIKEGKKSGYVVWSGGAGRGPDATIHSVLLVGNYAVSELSEGIRLHGEAGLGILFFAYTTTRIEYDSQMGFPREFQDSNPQLAFSARASLPIPAGQSFSIDPELRFMASTGGEKVMLFQMLIGLTYRW